MLHMNFPLNSRGAKPQLVLNIRNLFDEVYVQDATDNSRYNAVPFRVNTHTANAAEVFLGMPTAYNISLKLNFLKILITIKKPLHFVGVFFILSTETKSKNLI